MAKRVNRGREALQAGPGELAFPMNSELSDLQASGTQTPLHIPLHGPSMIPTLRPLDLLEVLPYGERAVRVGDVVAFLPAGKKMHVVHRVIEVGAAGIRTLGDNNIFDDPGLLQSTGITGRVIAAWRGQRRRRVYSGVGGQLLGRIVRISRALDRSISRALHSAYHALARRGVLRAVLPHSLCPRVVRFKADEREQLSLLFLGHWIGHYDADLRQWVIRRPFRLFVNETMLSELSVDPSE